MAILLGRAVVFGDLAPFGLALFVAVRWVRPEQSWPAAIGLAAVSYTHLDVYKRQECRGYG